MHSCSCRGGAQELTFEFKDLKPEDSINVEDWRLLGAISESQYNRPLDVCEKEVTIPVKKKDNRRPNTPVGNCRTWLDEAVEKLKTKGIL